MDVLAAELAARRKEHCFPAKVRSETRQLARALLALLFPHFADENAADEAEILFELHRVRTRLRALRKALKVSQDQIPDEAIDGFLRQLTTLGDALRLDAQAIHDGDPASTSVDEVILTYPGFFAIAVYRLSHALYQLSFPLIPRLLTEYGHERTGVDIHPGAQIGRSFCIDHGTGIVIGETAKIGNGVKLYQGVTLGALSVAKSKANRQRHPILEDNVVVYANATILGGDTVIGHDSIIGGNAWIVESVPPFSAVHRDRPPRPRREGEVDLLDFSI